MAFNAEHFSVLAYANGFTLWHYKSADAAAAIDTEGYFNTASDMVRIGDMILVNANTGSTWQNGMLIVASNASGVVDVTDLTAFGTADTD